MALPWGSSGLGKGWGTTRELRGFDFEAWEAWERSGDGRRRWRTGRWRRPESSRFPAMGAEGEGFGRLGAERTRRGTLRRKELEQEVVQAVFVAGGRRTVRMRVCLCAGVRARSVLAGQSGAGDLAAAAGAGRRRRVAQAARANSWPAAAP